MTADSNPAQQVRLQKALAAAGVASRRACETLITGGRVRINGKIVDELGVKINPATDEIRVDNVVVQLDTTKRYYLLNKPTGVVSTLNDDKGRKDLRIYTQHLPERVYNVGRLDTDTSGLLLLTNDGELANRLAHPKYGIQKTYFVKVRGKATPAVIRQLKTGIELADGKIQADAAKILATAQREYSLLEITLHSGRNRIVRRMLSAVGHPVLELHRKQFGPIHIGTLPVGQIRELAAAERAALLTAAASAAVAEQGKQVRLRQVTAGRPGDGAGAKGLKGIARPKPVQPAKPGNKRGVKQ